MLLCSHCLNAYQVHHIVTATLVWLYGRTDLNRVFLPVVITLLAFSCYRPLIIELVNLIIFFCILNSSHKHKIAPLVLITEFLGKVRDSVMSYAVSCVNCGYHRRH